MISQTDGVGSNQTLISYGENGGINITNREGCVSTRVFNENGLLTSYTDEVENTKTYSYDSNCNIISEIDALGNSATAVYNSFNNPTQLTDKNGNTTYYSYDNAGNLLKITYPQNSASFVEEIYTYNSRNQVTQYTDLRGTVTVYTYDSNDLLASQKVGAKPAIQYNYTNGLLSSKTDANGNTTTYFPLFSGL